MSLPDLPYFDRKFDEIHKRITDSDKENAKNLAEIEKKCAAHMAAPCRDVEKHVENCHKDVAEKKWGLIANIVAVIMALWAVLIGYKNGGKP